MGMFDNTFNVGDIPMESASGYGNTNAFMIGAMQGAEGMVSGLGKRIFRLGSLPEPARAGASPCVSLSATTSKSRITTPKGDPPSIVCS